MRNGMKAVIGASVTFALVTLWLFSSVSAPGQIVSVSAIVLIVPAIPAVIVGIVVYAVASIKKPVQQKPEQRPEELNTGRGRFNW